jgi:hypothetical protein
MWVTDAAAAALLAATSVVVGAQPVLQDLQWLNSGRVTASDLFSTLPQCCADVEPEWGFKAAGCAYELPPLVQDIQHSPALVSLCA